MLFHSTKTKLQFPF